MSPVNLVNKTGNFLLYLPSSERVAEWNSSDLPKQWGITSKESSQWSKTSDVLSEADRVALLDAFNLLAWKDEFPLEKLKLTSPAELISFRRQKEKELNLRRHNVFRDGVTYSKDYPAEIYD